MTNVIGVPVWLLLTVHGVLWGVAARLAAIRLGDRERAELAGITAFFLGPFGLLYTLFALPRHRRQCNWCKSWVPRDATACRYCARDLEPDA